MRPSKKVFAHGYESPCADRRNDEWRKTTAVVSKLNSSLRNWADYFKVGSDGEPNRALENYNAQLLRR
jgi:hypothetical protein